jgi:hypothetical protein
MSWQLIVIGYRPEDSNSQRRPPLFVKLMLRRFDLEGAPSRQLPDTNMGITQFLRSSLAYLMGRITRYNVAVGLEE